RRGTKCRAVRVCAATPALRGDGASLTEVLMIVRRSSDACKTPEDGTPAGAGGGAGTTPDGGEAGGGHGGNPPVFVSRTMTGACVTTRSHQGFHGASVSTVSPRANDSPAISIITGVR